MDFFKDKEYLKYFNQELIAKTGTEVLHNTILENKKNVFERLFLIKKKLLREDKGNKVLENSINYFLENLHTHNIKEQSKTKKNEIHSILTNKSKSASKILSKKIKTDSKIFVHSLNDHLLTSLNYSAKYNNFLINYIENNTNLKKDEIKNRLNNKNIISQKIDSKDTEEKLKNTDFCLLAAKRITKSKGVILKKGSKELIEKAQKHNIPVYVCAHSWNYSKKHNPNELMSETEKKHFEYIDKKKITAYIIEEGIYHPKKLRIN